MIHLGTIPASTTVYIPFTTYAGSTGASVTCTGLAVTDIEIYKNGSVTQRSSDAGIALLDTDGIDFDGITGLHGFSIDMSDNTDSGFYAVGSWYWVVVSAITVDSQAVTFLAATFRIGPAEVLSGHPKVDVGGWLGTVPATPTVAGVPEVDVTHVSGSAEDVATESKQNTAQSDLDILTGTDGATLATSQPNYAPATSAQATAIESDTQDLQTQIGVAGAGLTGIPKTGYKLASDGLDVIDATIPSAVATTFPGFIKQLWSRFFYKSTLSSTELITYASDGTTVVTTQTVSDTGTLQTQGKAS